MQKFQQDFIELALYAGALKFGSFTLKSGMVSPYFFSSGVFYSCEFCRALALIMAQKINRTIKPDSYDLLFGPAYKGIPLAVSTTMALAELGVNKGWCFNRKEEKAHGEGGALVGAPVEDGARLVLLDDVFTTGGAKEEAIAQLQAIADVKIAGVFILLDRQEKDGEGKNAIAAFERKHKAKVHAIVSADEIFSHLSSKTAKNPLSEETMKSYREYKAKYGV